MHNTLYLTYRPQNFDEIEGQQHIRRTIQNAAKQDKFAHAYLFSGPRGTGKTTTARIVAKAINCTSLLPDGNPCNLCSNCVEITQGSFVDVIEIDAASNRGIDEIRDLKERITFTPTIGKKKVYIIDEVHMLTKDAANALLKTLEEPPDHVHFILATTEFHKILPTVISRCQYFQYYPLTIEDIVERLSYISQKEGFYFEKEALELLAESAKGGMRDAISLLEKAASQFASVNVEHVKQILGTAGEELYKSLLDTLQSKESSAFVEALQEIERIGTPPEQFLRAFRKYVRKLYIAELAKGAKAQNLPFYTVLLSKTDTAVKESKYSEFPLLPLELMMGEMLVSSGAIVQAPPIQVTTPKSVAPTPAPAAVIEPPIAPKPVAPSITPPSENTVAHTDSSPETVPTASTSATTEDSGDWQKLKAEWASFCFKLGEVALRSALKSCSIIGVKNGVLELSTTNSIHHQALNTQVALGKVSDALKEHYDLSYTVAVELLKKSTTSNVAAPSRHPSPETAKEKETRSPTTTEPSNEELEKIAALFGGQIVD